MKSGWPIFDSSDEQGLIDVIRSGNWWRGAYESSEGTAHGEGYVQKFEQALGELHNTKFCMAVSNGTMALDIAVRSLDLEPGDEVITTPYTYAGSATCIYQSGATPIFADIDPFTWNIDPVSIERLCTNKTKAVIIVHFAGLPVNMDEILKLRDKYKFCVIEDTAHAFMARWKDRLLGTVGDIGCFSFQASKNLTTGEGGAIMTNSQERAQTISSLHWAGRRKSGPWYEHELLGWNARMTEFQGALGLTQLEKFHAQHSKRKQNARILVSGLSQIPGLIVQPIPDNDLMSHGLHLICFRYNSLDWGGISPKRLYMALRAADVPVIPGYGYPLYRNPVFKNPPSFVRALVNKRRSQEEWEEICPNVEMVCRSTFWLHHSVLLGEEQDMNSLIERVVQVHKFCNNKK